MNWKSIKGYEGIYSVNEDGEVRSEKRENTYFNPYVNKVVSRYYKEKILKPKENRGGYLVLHLRNCEEESWPTVHRLVAEAFIPNPLNKPSVNHIDGNKKNNKVSNLEWVTCSENTRHAYSSGLLTSRIKEFSLSGEDNHSSKLRNSDIPEIIKHREDGKTYKELSTMYGISISSIARICNGESWRSVSGK